MKHVVSNPYHLWAHQVQNNARNSSGNRSFDGPNALSYSTIVATIVTNAKGERAYLLTTRDYSVTTARHMSEIRRAIPSDAVVFYVPNVNTYEHAANVVYYLNEVKKYDAKVKTARLWKDSEAQNALYCILKARAYVKFFGLKGMKLPGPKAIAARQAQVAALTAELIPKRQAEEAKRAEASRVRRAASSAYWAEYDAKRIAQEKEDAEHAAENLEKWLKGEPGGKVHRATYPGDYLRVRGDVVETSAHAEVPLADVLKVLPEVCKMLLHDAPLYIPSEKERPMLGHYALSEITEDGTVIVGCHRFAKAEVLRFAEVLAAQAATTPAH